MQADKESWGILQAVHKVTGDYDLDATILHRRNKDLPDRLKLYTKRGSYSYKTAYNAYSTVDD